MSLHLIAAMILFHCTFATAKSPLKFSGFLDTYYAYDFNQPVDDERSYTTQPVRHNEPNINLVYIDGTYTTEKFRSRVAVQAGDSVRKNTVQEPGGEELEYIQEAFVGWRTGEETWIDGGIYFGHIGAESWISRDNFTYSRSLNLDYVPYYSAGIRITHKNFQFHIMNGWQNISDNNSAKAIGTQYKKQLGLDSTFTWNTFFGDEEVVNDRSTFRSYNNFILTKKLSKKWDLVSAADIGHQKNVWYAGTMTARYNLNDYESLSMRTEYYNDPHQSNVVTNTEHGFEVLGASMNYDNKIKTNLLWRNEIRGFYSKDRIYPNGERINSFFVTSFSVWF